MKFKKLIWACDGAPRADLSAPTDVSGILLNCMNEAVYGLGVEAFV
jgi:hypothetical protein